MRCDHFKEGERHFSIVHMWMELCCSCAIKLAAVETTLFNERHGQIHALPDNNILINRYFFCRDHHGYAVDPTIEALCND